MDHRRDFAKGGSRLVAAGLAVISCFLTAGFAPRAEAINTFPTTDGYMQPFVSCIAPEVPVRGRTTVYFGYASYVSGRVHFPPGVPQNWFDPGPTFPEQIQIFDPGYHDRAYAVTIDSTTKITWKMFGLSATATGPFHDAAGDVTSPVCGPFFRGAWASGFKYIAQEIVTYAGDSWIADRFTTETPGTGTAWSPLTTAGLDGAPGPTGATGLRGATGFTGATGLIGPIGFTGPTGATGLRGTTGDAGATGERGATGIQGPTGERGATGDQGATGEAGAKGDRGAPGVRGDTGEAGATGDQGAPGDQGEAGEPGQAGQQGVPGEDGATGEVGATGERGKPGDAGATGPQGPIGKNGSAGRSGPTGPTGATGESAIETNTTGHARFIRRGKNTVRNARVLPGSIVILQYADRRLKRPRPTNVVSVKRSRFTATGAPMGRFTYAVSGG